ncbi:MAG: radical SAM protein [Alphaproteobacteria bacterium]|nr:radical SAM protein [Alphaproteobacteria bacterium]MCB9698163.1 radical SAM protein [Alphaproteobacteria bacterium]
MRYEGKIYRPPSEADAYLLQATIGCSWNHCTYCDMYRDKTFRVRDPAETLHDLRVAGQVLGGRVRKLFVCDGDALVMPVDVWLPLLATAREVLPSLERVSCYATAGNVLEKSDEDLRALREAGLSRLYIGPESGDPATLKAIAKGATFEEHEEAARRAKAAGMELSVITLLGAGGVARSEEHARATAKLLTAMDPEYAAALTLTVVPGTPQHKLEASGRFELPDLRGLLSELRILVHEARPTDAVFRTNHASNHLPLAGRLPRDRERIVAVIDAALQGRVPLRPESYRGL